MDERMLTLDELHDILECSRHSHRNITLVSVELNMLYKHCCHMIKFQTYNGKEMLFRYSETKDNMYQLIKKWLNDEEL